MREANGQCVGGSGAREGCRHISEGGIGEGVIVGGQAVCGIGDGGAASERFRYTDPRQYGMGFCDSKAVGQVTVCDVGEGGGAASERS